MTSIIPPFFANGQRKFALAAFASGSALALCWHGSLAGGHWVAAQSLILGLYHAANVTDKRMGGAG